MRIFLLFTLFVTFSIILAAQTGKVTGIVKTDGYPIEYAQVIIDSSSFGALTNVQGRYTITKLPYGKYKISASYIGYKKVFKEFVLSEEQKEVNLDLDMTEQVLDLDGIVVTATKTPKRRTNSAVIVNVINSQTISNVQACNLSEGLKFQPGLRVETDCQTCNYTQLRMNGLGGGYSQILVNGRPIFSPLTGLYGMEQLPANMIDRIEVLRGGGSSLYGSSAIGGTVNVITKIPQDNAGELNYTYQNIDGQTSDHNISGNASLVSKNRNAGVSIFMNKRDRGFYDANGDSFSEIALINSTALGANMFFLPKENQKLEINFSNLREYRFGGEMVVDKPAYLAQQAEERTHGVWMASADYQIKFDNDNSSIITYLAWQNTDRKHYTGIQPDTVTAEYDKFIKAPPYGTSDVSTYNVGMQLNHKINNFLKGKNVFTLGLEYVYDDVFDEISSYQYLIDQTTKDLGAFVQSDWEIIPQLTFLAGARMDKHNLIDNLIFSPRASLLYKLKKKTQFRFSYGSGFRAPQAFDTDLHIAFAAGGVSRVSLSPNLVEERSHSLSASINYDKPMKKWIIGYTVEGFYNRLNNAFYLEPIGQDQFGQRFDKRNGDGATVQGITLELRANFNRKVQLEGGFTLQSSIFDKPVQYIEGVEGIREFIRTPNDYGYAILTFTPNNKWNASLNYVYTGKMKVPHFAGATNQLKDEIIESETFSNLSIKIGRDFSLKNLGTIIEIYGGLKNIFNSYQTNFDIGKNRDSNFIYGPGNPRTLFVGIKLKYN